MKNKTDYVYNSQCIMYVESPLVLLATVCLYMRISIV